MKPEGIPIHIPLLFRYYPITIHIKHYKAIIKPYFPLFFDQMSGDAIVDVTTGVLERFLPERLVSIGCVWNVVFSVPPKGHVDSEHDQPIKKYI